jgi:hypothetical protein
VILGILWGKIGGFFSEISNIFLLQESSIALDKLLPPKAGQRIYLLLVPILYFLWLGSKATGSSGSKGFFSLVLVSETTYVKLFSNGAVVKTLRRRFFNIYANCIMHGIL